MSRPPTGHARSRRRLLLGAAAVAALPLAAVAEPAAFPVPGRPVRIVVPAPPGGPADILGRALGNFLSQSLGVPVIIDSKPGGASVPAALAVAHAAPDGHTILLTINTTHTQVPHLFAKPPYDPFKDFTPLTQVYRNGSVLLVHPSVPANDLRELIAYSRASGPLAAGSPGPGTNGHLYIEMLDRQYGARLNHIPYKGSSDASRDLIGGFVQVLFDSPATAIPNVKAGLAKAVAVTGTRRFKELPEVRTGHEQGFPALDITGWMGFFGPAGMPRATVEKLNTELVAAIRRPEIRQQFEPFGVELTGTTAQEFAAIVKADYETWGRIIKETGVRIDQ